MYIHVCWYTNIYIYMKKSRTFDFLQPSICKNYKVRFWFPCPHAVAQIIVDIYTYIWQSAIKKVDFQRAGLTTRCCKPGKSKKEFVCFFEDFSRVLLAHLMYPIWVWVERLFVDFVICNACTSVCVYISADLPRASCVWDYTASLPPSQRQPSNQPDKPSRQASPANSQASLPDHPTGSQPGKPSRPSSSK